MAKPLVSVIMGSTSDLPIMQNAADLLEELGVPHEIRIISAHRTPDLMFKFASEAQERGIKVIIAGAGGAAHLPGMIASHTVLPVIGVPIMVYNDKDGNKQTIKTAEHFKLKRQQTLEALQKVMGKLPERPKRTSLKDFNIRVSEELTKVRGRYTKQTIHFFVAKDEEVHANLYIPLNMKPGEKRPAIVGMHPFSRAGKGSFEKWPNLNFVIELAMQGFIVIMLDYPGFGEALDYEYDNPRYGSGRIHGVYNHMSTVDLLQLPPG